CRAARVQGRGALLHDAALLSRILARSVTRRWDEIAPPALLPRNPDSLSDVQWEVLRLVARGLSNAEIARARTVSEKAVEHAVTRLCRKLGIDSSSGANSRVMLTRYYFTLTGARA
ncbi:MAG: helix-turn-helix domain-containing protein, partial [Candidatus Nanopelagicales bacterium]